MISEIKFIEPDQLTGKKGVKKGKRYLEAVDNFGRIVLITKDDAIGEVIQCTIIAGETKPTDSNWKLLPHGGLAITYHKGKRKHLTIPSGCLIQQKADEIIIQRPCVNYPIV